MTSPPEKKLPPPWHTKSFHRARLVGGVGLLVFLGINAVLDNRFNVALIYVPMLIVVDYATISEWKKGKVVTAPLLAYGAQGSSAQIRHLWATIGGFIFALVVTLIVFEKEIVKDGVSSILQLSALTGINLFGWFLIPWIKEVVPMIKHYYSHTKMTQQATASHPTVVQYATSNTSVPAVSPQAQTLHIGNGGRP